MAKKIVSADTLTAKEKTTSSSSESNIDLGKLADLVTENKDTIGKIAGTLLTSDTKSSSKKKTTKSSSSTSDILTKIIELLKSLFGSK